MSVSFIFPDVSGTAWFMSGGDYVKEAANTVVVKLNESGRKLGGKAEPVVRAWYCLKLYVSPVLNYYQ